MPATLTQIAREAEVSVSLVSRFVNSDPKLRISPEKRQRILDAQQRLGGIRANQAGKSLATGLAYNIVCPINRNNSDDFTRRYLTGSDLYASMEDELREAGFRLSVNFFDPASQRAYFEDLAESRHYSDGLFLATRIVDESLAQFLLERQVPHVCIDSRAERLGVNTVCDSPISGMQLAVEHLAQLGHRQITFVGLQCPWYFAFCSVMAEMGLPLSEHHRCAVEPLADGQPYEQWREQAGRTVKGWLDQNPPVTAMVSSKELIAMGIVDALRARGLEPGKDVSVVGNDESWGRSSHAPDNHPVLTRVVRPTRVIGQRCAAHLLRQIQHKNSQVMHERVPVRLVMGQSTGPCRMG